MHTTRSDSIQLTTFFCLTKYELVRTTKFTRLVLPLLYVKRFEKNSPSVMFSNQYACVRSLLVKHRTDCPPLLRRFSIAFPLFLPPRCLANTKRPPPHPPRRPATTLFGHGDGAAGAL